MKNLHCQFFSIYTGRIGKRGKNKRNPNYLFADLMIP
jgi:hypothetical protein